MILRSQNPSILLLIIIFVFGGLSGCINTLPARADTNSKLPTLLYASWCPICHEAKAFLEENNVTFEVADIDTSALGKSLFQQSGALGPPVLYVCGKFHHGFNKREWKKALAETCQTGHDSQYYALSFY